MSAAQARPGREAIPDHLFQDAAGWVARLGEADADDATHEAFQDWLARDPQHLDAYDQAERLWTSLGTRSDGQRDIHAVEDLVASVKPRRSRRLIRGGSAALCLLALVFAGEWWRRGGLDDLRADYVTAPGTSHVYELADGSVMELNTDSSVAVDFVPGRRAMRVFRGEVLFRVAHDPARPFVVATEDGTTTVTGTTFNVRAMNGETIVSLLEGRVSLSPADHPDRLTELAPGQEAEVTRRAIGSARLFEPGTTTAWRHGQVVFFRTPLGEVVDELNRYQRGRIMILGDDLRSLAVTGVFDARDPEAAIDVIETTLGVSSTRFGSALIVLR